MALVVILLRTCVLRAYAGHGGPDPQHRRGEAAAAKEEKKRRRRHDQDQHGGTHRGTPSPAAGGCLKLGDLLLLPRRQRRDRYLLDPQPVIVASLSSAAAVHLWLPWLACELTN